MIRFSILLSVVLFTSCYNKPEIEGFDEHEWKTEINNCQQSKVAQAELLIENEDKLLGEGQAVIKSLLGQPDAHELYRRNQKFFYYNLTVSDTCPNIKKTSILSIHFDAIDRVKELTLVE